MSKTAVAEVLANLRRDIRGQVGAGVVHRQDDARERELGIEVLANEIDRAINWLRPFEGVVLALDGDEDRVGRRQRVDGQESQ